jgi:hypothetical protein
VTVSAPLGRPPHAVAAETARRMLHVFVHKVFVHIISAALAVTIGGPCARA